MTQANETTAMAIRPDQGALMERVLAAGDLSKLTPLDRSMYYAAVCESVGLNPLTKPFEYITLNGKLILYALKGCTDQLRKIHDVRIEIISRERLDELYVVTARASLPAGRQDEEIGAVTIGNLRGDNLANALMKATTKAKRRVTLSICGLGLLDETELETIPADRKRLPTAPAPRVDTETGEIIEGEETGEAEPPDLTSDEHFRAEWSRVLMERGFTPDAAAAFLTMQLKAKDLALDALNLKGRQALLWKAEQGGYDAAIKAAAQPAATAQATEPATSPDVNTEARFWQIVEIMAGEKGVKGEHLQTLKRLIDKRYPQVALKTDRAVPHRMRVLDAIDSGAMNLDNAEINQVAEALTLG